MEEKDEEVDAVRHMKEWVGRFSQDEHLLQPRRISADRGRRVSAGYHGVGQQLGIQMALKSVKEAAERPEMKLDEEDAEDSVHRVLTGKTEAGLGQGLTTTDAKQLEKKQLKEAVLNGHNSELNSIMYDFVDSKIFAGFILSVILLNTGILMAQTYEEVNVRTSWYFSGIDSVFLSVYLVECIVKLYVYRKLYFKDGWNILDFAIVIFNIVDVAVAMIVQNIEGVDIMAIFQVLRMLRAFRAIRALRVLRTIRFLSSLQVIMTTCLQSIQSMGAIVMLILLVLYMFAVIGRGMYFKVDSTRFGSLPSAAFTLFQLLTLDDWFEVYTDATQQDPGSWHIFFFLLAFIVMEYFVFLNLFVAVLVDNFQLTLEASNEEKRKLLSAQAADEEDDDEDDIYNVNKQDDDASDTTRKSEQSARLPRKSLSELYMDEELGEQDHLRYFFQCMTALEYNWQMLNSQQKTIDNIVDICIETSDDVVT